MMLMGTKLRFFAGLLSVFLLLPQAVLALEGSYRGVHEEQPVKASFNSLESSLTGMLSIGEQRYMLLADEAGSGGYAGKLHNLVSGEMISVELKVIDDRLEIEFKGVSAAVIELKRADQ
jgi:hypothetical protein